jgi:predicted dehydrogenase
MHKKIHWGILGTGMIAHNFVAGLHELPDAVVRAVGSRTKEKAELFAHNNDVTQAYGSYEQLVADKTIDIVYIATPHHRHYEDIILCLNNGKHVLCEKPFTLTATQARQVVDLSRKKQLFCMEAMWMRYIPLVQAAKQMVRDGKIGDPLLLTADFGSPTIYDPANRFFNEDMGGGALLDRGVYLISLAYYLFGSPQQIVTAAKIGNTGVDEQSAIILKYPDGKLAVLHASLFAKSSNSAVIMGTNGSITLAEPFLCSEKMTVTLHPQPKVTAGGHESSRGIGKSLVACIKAVPVIATMARKMKSILKGKTVIIQPHKGNAYRYEAMEVMRCLHSELTESPVMPLDETIEIMETMDNVRATWIN